MGVADRRQREREARREAVLEAARSLVRERGFTGTTTRLIAERCELSEATLFFYFRGKNEILSSLLFEGIDFTAAGLQAILAEDVPAANRLGRFWAFLSELQTEHPEYFHVFAYLAHPNSTSSVDDNVRDELARRSGDNLRILAEILADAVGRERARIAADLVWAAFAGLMVLRETRTNLGAAVHPDASDLRTALELLLAGIAPKGAGRAR